MAGLRKTGAIALLCLVATPGATQLSAAQAKDGISIVYWNIQTVATPGRQVFTTSHIRKKQDHDDLATVRARLSPHIAALQEISSPAALALVFPVDECVICFLGQREADAKGFGPAYGDTRVKDIKPICLEDSSSKAADTAPSSALGQYVAFDVESSEVLDTDLWDALEGTRTAVASDDVDLRREPYGQRKLCWPDGSSTSQSYSIDFFVLSPGAWKLRVPGSYEKIRYADLFGPGVELTQEADGPRFSDHCPIKLRLKGP